jgi:hypothetical protein
MSKDARKFISFMTAMLLPAFLAGTAMAERWSRGFEPVIVILWLAGTLLGIGYTIDGLRGAKALIFGTAKAWGLMAAVALPLGILVALKFGGNP